MDALTWFKSVFRRALATPALRADLATEAWDDVPLHLVAARLRPRAAPADADDGWDAVIARSKAQAAPPKAPSPPPPPPPRAMLSIARPKAPRANPDVVAWGPPGHTGRGPASR